MCQGSSLPHYFAEYDFYLQFFIVLSLNRVRIVFLTSLVTCRVFGTFFWTIMAYAGLVARFPSGPQLLQGANPKYTPLRPAKRHLPSAFDWHLGFWFKYECKSTGPMPFFVWARAIRCCINALGPRPAPLCVEWFSSDASGPDICLSMVQLGKAQHKGSLLTPLEESFCL